MRRIKNIGQSDLGQETLNQKSGPKLSLYPAKSSPPAANPNDVVLETYIWTVDQDNLMVQINSLVKPNDTVWLYLIRTVHRY